MVRGRYRVGVSKTKTKEKIMMKKKVMPLSCLMAAAMLAGCGTADKFTHDAPPAVLAGLYGKETREVKLIQVDFCCVSVAVNGFVWHHRDYPPCFLFVLTWIQ